MDHPSVGIFAPSSPVGSVELGAGVAFLRDQGFKVTVHPQTKAESFIFAGTDDARAGALYELAMDPKIDVVWAARGGYGAQSILPALQKLTARKKPTRKLLIGYSDVTVLHEFVRRNWNWSTLHAPMPSSTSFTRLDNRQWQNVLQLVDRQFVEYPASQKKLTWMTDPPKRPIRTELVGGNLSLWQSLVGTPWAPTSGSRRILFFEDVDEKLYRIDRMIKQIAQAGLLEGAAAMVLGDFTNCDDENNTCLAPCTGAALTEALAGAGNARRRPLRRTYSTKQGLTKIFLPICQQYKIPLARGLPVGHGPSYYPLPLGADYELNPSGELKLCSWSWAGKSSGANSGPRKHLAKK